MSKEYLEETAAVQEQEGQALTEEQLDGVSGGGAILRGPNSVYTVGPFYCIVHDQWAITNVALRSKCAAATVNTDMDCCWATWDAREEGAKAQGGAPASQKAWRAKCHGWHLEGNYYGDGKTTLKWHRR